MINAAPRDLPVRALRQTYFGFDGSDFFALGGLVFGGEEVVEGDPMGGDGAAASISSFKSFKIGFDGATTPMPSFFCANTGTEAQTRRAAPINAAMRLADSIAAIGCSIRDAAPPEDCRAPR
jgi:hypothetical protein